MKESRHYGAMTLYDTLRYHDSLDRSSFHTPGHKCSGFFPEDLLQLDYTELPDTDALYEASGPILRSEKKLAHLFGAGRSLISAGGCSLAIQAMLRLASMQQGKILCARNAHRSAINACALLGLEPVWLYPDSSRGFTGRISPEDVRAAFEENENITACYITSPSYYGELCDIGSIAEICHENGAILLVDNAHGSHLAFMKENMHPMFLGADMTACSLHKTLPVLTGGAVLNLRDESLGSAGKAAMSLFGSTSPSYPIMCSIDLCADYLENGGAKEYARCEDTVSELKAAAVKKGIAMPEGKCDPLRLTLGTAAAGLSGDKQQSYFEDCGIDCEFCDGVKAVFIITPFNSERDISRLRSAIENMPVGNAAECQSFEPVRPEKAMTLREALLSPTKIVPVAASRGMIAADTACPCPPGVPVVMPGELIDSLAISEMQKRGMTEIIVVK